MKKVSTVDDLENITARLADWQPGTLMDERLFEDCIPIFKRNARTLLAKEHCGLTFGPAPLISALWCELKKKEGEHWKNRRHFFAVATKIMRRHLVDEARKRATKKRGGNLPFVSRADVVSTAPTPEDVVLMDGLLGKLSAHHPAQAKAVELKFFFGMTQDEISEQIGVSTRTVRTYLTGAMAWMKAQMEA